ALQTEGVQKRGNSVKQVALALCAVLSVVVIGCGDNIKPTDCTAADCDDPVCQSVEVCQVACGNGRVEATEAWHDGKTIDGDGCDENCTMTRCGNGVVTANETCDDGNAVDGDGCDNNCKPTGCGNGVVTANETCDDGNTTNGDGCD